MFSFPVCHWSSATGGIFVNVRPFTITINAGSNSATATIAAVNTAYSTIFFDGNSIADTGAIGWSTRVALTNSTTVTAYRAAAGNDNINIVNGVVVEWNPAFVNKVASGTIDLLSGSGTATLPSSFNVNTTALLFAGFETSGSSSASLFPYINLQDATTVAGTTSGTGIANTAGFFAIEFNASKLQNSVIESSNVNINSGTSATATITSVTTSKTLLFSRGLSVAAGNAEDALARYTLTNSTTVTATVGSSGIAHPVSCYFDVVAFTDGINSIQRFQTPFGNTETQTDTTITSVNTSKSIVNYLGVSNTSGAVSTGIGRVYLNSATVVRQNRASQPATGTTISFEVIEST